MGLTGSPTTALYFDAVHVDDDRLIGAEGQGMRIALSALDSGRLGIAACATGLAQAALDVAVGYAKERRAVRPADRGVPGDAVPAGRDGGRGRHGPGLLPDGGPQAGRRPAVHPGRGGGQDDRHRCRDEGDHRRGPGARRLRLHPGLPGRALHARGEGDPDLRGHQPDPAAGDRPSAAARTGASDEARGSADDVVLVTGGASGLGAATVRALAGRRASGGDHGPAGSAGAALAAELGDRVRFAAADVRDEDQVQAAIDAAARAGRRCGSRSTAPGWPRPAG